MTEITVCGMAMSRVTEDYQLPDGTVVACDATAVKAAFAISFQLASGRMVVATRVAPVLEAIDRLRIAERGF